MSKVSAKRFQGGGTLNANVLLDSQHIIILELVNYTANLITA